MQDFVKEDFMMYKAIGFNYIHYGYQKMKYFDELLIERTIRSTGTLIDYGYDDEITTTASILKDAYNIGKMEEQKIIDGFGKEVNSIIRALTYPKSHYNDIIENFADQLLKNGDRAINIEFASLYDDLRNFSLGEVDHLKERFIQESNILLNYLQRNQNKVAEMPLYQLVKNATIGKFDV